MCYNHPMKNNRLAGFWGPVHEPARMLKYVAAAAGIIGATVLLEEFLRPYRDDVELVLLFMLSTFLIACITGSYAINLASAVVNTFLYDYFVTAPRLGFSFTLGLPATLFSMLVVSVITSAATTKIREQVFRAQQQERRTELMLEINKKMSAADGPNAVARIAIDYLSLYAMSGLFYMGDPSEGVYVAFPAGRTPTEQDTGQAHDCYTNPARCETHAAVHYIPLRASGRVPLGVIGLAHPDREQLAFARLLAGQTALAMELKQAMEERTKTLMLAEKEKTRSNLLRAISHDLRTPLTSILSASTIMAEKTGDPMARDIQTDSEWLIRMVENLLMVTRIAEGENRIAKKPDVAEEVMARAVSIVRKRFPGCRIRVEAPGELVIVPMDAMLMSQVFINLLENAVKHSPTDCQILFRLFVEGTFACFTVDDGGTGIPDDVLNDIFGQHAAAGPAGGMGLGLSICQTIVDVHGGTICGENKAEGGALFTVCLPMNA